MHATTLFATLALTLFPLAAQQPRPQEARPKPDPARMAKHLGLNESQQKQVQAVIDQHKAALETKQKAAQSAHHAFREALHNPATEPAALKKLHDTATDCQFELFLEHRAQRQAMRALLTSEQREKAAFAMGRHEGRQAMKGALEARGQHRAMRGMGRGMIRALNLTEDQVKQLDSLRKTQGEKARTLGREALEARKAFQEAARNPDTKPQELSTLHRTLADRQFAAVEAGRARMQAMEKVLTPEQKATWAKLQATRKDQGPAGGGMGHRFGRR